MAGSIHPLRQFFSKSTLLLLIPLLVPGESFGETTSVQGIVRDAETEWPLEKVTVYLLKPTEKERLEAATDSDGTFNFPSLDPGTYEIVISAVGYGLVKRALEVGGTEPVEVEIFLAAGTRLATEITIASDAPRSNVELSSSEIEQLRTVLIDDPIRSLQKLPSLISNDDFNTGFAVQGAGFNRVGILMDGVPVYNFLHTIDGIEDTGSTTLLSAELIDGMEFHSGGTSGQWASSSAGLLNLRSRTGNNRRLRNLVSVSGSAFLFVSEGPVAQGNWIASARKSYVDWIVRRVDPNSSLNFGFYDFFGKVTQSIGSKHQLMVSFFHGNTGLRDVVEGSSLTSIDQGRLKSSLIQFGWDCQCEDWLTGSTHVYYQQADANNENQLGRRLWESGQQIAGVRSIWDLRPTKRLTFSGGVTLESWSFDETRDRYRWDLGEWDLAYAFDESTGRQHLFGETAFEILPGLRLLGGWNWSRQGDLARHFQSPYLGAEYLSGGHSISIYWGETGQFPFFNQVYGPWGNAKLKAEESSAVQGSWGYRSPDGLNILLSAFQRERKGVPWRREGLWRLEDGVITAPESNDYENLLEDRTYGAEMRFGRSAPTGFSGWVGYAWSKSEWSESPHVWFPGNYDQRNGLSLFAHYRWTSQFELTLKWKAASGLPLPAYAESRDGNYYVAEARNRERLPVYSRLDVRFGKTFNKDRYRITLFVEVVNLTNRENLRFAGHDEDSVNPWTGRIYGLTQEQFPILPTAGLVVEF